MYSDGKKKVESLEDIGIKGYKTRAYGPSPKTIEIGESCVILPTWRGRVASTLGLQ
jgi:hypothetical protein